MNKKRNKKEPEDVMADDKTEQGSLVTLVTHVRKIAFFFSVDVVYINNQHFFKSKTLHVHQSYISTTLNWEIFEYNWDWHCKWFEEEEYPNSFFDTPLSQPCCHGEWNCSVDPMAPCCLVNWWLTFSPFWMVISSSEKQATFVQKQGFLLKV